MFVPVAAASPELSQRSFTVSFMTFTLSFAAVEILSQLSVIVVKKAFIGSRLPLIQAVMSSRLPAMSRIA